jgi:hypothetical protein
LVRGCPAADASAGCTLKTASPAATAKVRAAHVASDRRDLGGHREERVVSFMMKSPRRSSVTQLTRSTWAHHVLDGRVLR